MGTDRYRDPRRTSHPKAAEASIRADRGRGTTKEDPFMQKKLALLVSAGFALGTIVVAAPPAQASCDTELGDMCKFMRVACNITDPAHKVRDLVVNCENW